MKNINSDALTVLAEVSMEINDYDAQKSFEQIKLIDDLLSVINCKSLINRFRGRRSNKERGFDDVFRNCIYNHVKGL